MASTLEAEMLYAIRVLGLPDPITEKHFDWCCDHPKTAHHAKGKPGKGLDALREPWPATCDDCEDFHEYRHGRAFRFDLCWLDAMLAVELDGATWAAGRHTRGAGFQSDAEKRNLAQLLGWRVLTFTRRDVTSGQALTTIEAALEAHRARVAAQQRLAEA